MRNVLRQVDKDDHPDRRSTGWQRVAGLAVVGTVGTVTAVLTGSTETVVGVVLLLLPYIP